MFKFEKLKDTKLSFILPILSLCVIGGITVFSTTYDNGISSMFTNHLAFYLVGFVLFLTVSTINPAKLKLKIVNLLIVAFSIASLVAVIFLGTEIYGAQRWIDLGFFSFQPSEFVKVSIILFTAFCLGVRTKRETEEIFNIYLLKESSWVQIRRMLTSEEFIKSAMAILFYLVSVVLIIKQKSLGNSILLTLIFLSILLINLNISPAALLFIVPLIVGILISFNIVDLGNLSNLFGFNFYLLVSIVIIILIYYLGKRLKLNTIIMYFFFGVGLLAQPAISFSYNQVLEPYQRQRIESFLGAEDDVNLFQNEDFNRQMSILAVGSGRVFGKGLLKGNIVNSRLLPFAFTDFAFAGFAEQFGFVGGLLIISLYIILLIKIFKIFLKTNDNFYRFICIGVISLIFFNCAQHIAMNMGITPITGVPLPLISYGGSSILSIFIGLGIVNAIDVFGDQDIQIESLSADYGFNDRT